ncbi:MAG: 5-oxoprolinase subunit PxpB [Cyclobacteriaceae bacterium]
MMALPTITSLGESTVLIDWDSQLINDALLQHIMNWKHTIETELGEAIVECIPAYSSLGVVYDSERFDFAELKVKLENLTIDQEHNKASKTWQVPVCYDEAFSVDLSAYCQSKSLSRERVIKLHTQNSYRIHFFGFLPGFMYLGGLTEELHLPRKSTPSRQIVPGSVAIGGKQTGIYPSHSPGGWHVIGNTPVSLFDPSKSPPVPFDIGDRIQFVPIGLDEYHGIKGDVERGKYQLISSDDER